LRLRQRVVLLPLVSPPAAQGSPRLPGITLPLLLRGHHLLGTSAGIVLQQAALQALTGAWRWRLPRNGTGMAFAPWRGWPSDRPVRAGCWLPCWPSLAVSLVVGLQPLLAATRARPAASAHCRGRLSSSPTERRPAVPAKSAQAGRRACNLIQKGLRKGWIVL